MTLYIKWKHHEKMIICTHISSFVISYNLDDLKLNHSFVKHINHLHIVLGLFLAHKSFVKITIISLDYILSKETHWTKETFVKCIQIQTTKSFKSFIVWVFKYITQFSGHIS